MADLKYTVQVDTRGATKNVQGLSGALGGLKKLGVVAVAAGIAKGLYEVGQASIEATRQFQTLQNQLRLITNGSEDLERITAKLTETARANRTSFEATVDLFTKLTLSTAELGKTEEEVILVTTKLSQALAVAGADASTTNSVIRQFGQAMASGTVRGDEFNSIVEGLGPALAIMARETGLNVGQLRAMSREGKLTADTMFDMLTQSKALTAAFQSQLPTIDQLETALGDAFDRALVKLGEVSGITKLYEETVKDLTRTFDKLAQTEGTLATMSPEEVFAKIQDGSVSAAAGAEELQAKFEDLINLFNLFENKAGGAFGVVGAGYAGLDQIDALVEKSRELRAAGYEDPNFFEALLNHITTLGGATRILTNEEIARYDAVKQLAEASKQLAEQQAQQAEAAKKALEQQANLDKEYTKFVGSVNGLGNAIKQSSEYMSESDAGKFLSDIQQAQKDFDDASEAVRILQETLTNLESGNTTLQDSGDRADELRNNLNAAREALQYYSGVLDEAKANQAELDEEIRRAGLTEYQRYLEDVIAAAQKTITETENQKKAIEDLKAKMLADPDKANIYQQAIDDIENLKEAYDQLRDNMADIQTIEEWEATQRAINEAYQSGKIDLKEYQQLLDELRQKYEELDPVAAAFKDALNRAGDQLADDLVEGRDALDSFKDFFKNIVKDMLKEAIKLIFIKQLLGGLAGMFGYDVEFTGSSITGISKRAKGGPVNANQPYIVGEQGPEMFVPNSSGNIVPNNQLGNGGGGVVNNTYITNQISALDAKSVAQLFAENRKTLLGTVQNGTKRNAIFNITN